VFYFVSKRDEIDAGGWVDGNVDSGGNGGHAVDGRLPDGRRGARCDTYASYMGPA
jgi:hypothetical protein